MPTEIRQDGQHRRKKDAPGAEGLETGDSGLRDEGSAEARWLALETTDD
jgi:hypothetical protein